MIDIGKSIFATELEKRKAPEPYSQFITAYEFFDVLLTLFNDIGQLNLEGKTLDKITLLQQYPDEEYLKDLVVVYKLGEREFFTHKSEGSAGSYQQVRPMELEANYDLVSNNIVSTYANKFITSVTLEVISPSNKDLERTVQFIEAIMLKHRSKLKCFVADYIYSGQSPTGYSQGSQNRRLFSRSLFYKIITYETYDLVFEELKYIRN